MHQNLLVIARYQKEKVQKSVTAVIGKLCNDDRESSSTMLRKKRFYFSLDEFCKCLHLLGVSKYVTPAVNAKLKYEKYAELNLFKLLCSINGNKCIDNVKRTLTELNESWNTVDGKRDIYTIHLTKEEVEQRELFMNQRHSRILQRGSSRRRKLNKVNLHKSTTRIVQ